MQRKAFMLLVACAAFTVACGSDSKPTQTNNGSSKVLSATINGTAFAPTLISGSYNGGNLTISGSAGLRNLNISATGLNGAGTYLLSGNTAYTALATYVDGNSGQYSTGYSGNGTLVLTEARLGRVTGTFTFIAYTSAGTGAGKPVVTVQQGTFDITIP